MQVLIITLVIVGGLVAASPAQAQTAGEIIQTRFGTLEILSSSVHGCVALGTHRASWQLPGLYQVWFRNNCGYALMVKGITNNTNPKFYGGDVGCSLPWGKGRTKMAILVPRGYPLPLNKHTGRPDQADGRAKWRRDNGLRPDWDDPYKVRNGKKIYAPWTSKYTRDFAILGLINLGTIPPKGEKPKAAWTWSPYPSEPPDPSCDDLK